MALENLKEIEKILSPSTIEKNLTIHLQEEIIGLLENLLLDFFKKSMDKKENLNE